MKIILIIIKSMEPEEYSDSEIDIYKIAQLRGLPIVHSDFQEGGVINDEVRDYWDDNGDIIPMIHYVEDVNTRAYEYDKIKDIAHEELKVMKPEQLANMSMFEIVPTEGVRVYFDFDIFYYSERSTEKVPYYINKILNTCDSLVEILGDFSYAGYTTNKSVSEEYDIRYYEQKDKILSLHVVFYESKVSRSDLYMVSRALEYKKSLCDTSVYEPEDNRCLLRHIMTSKGTIKSYGTIAEGKTPDTQAVTPNEKEKMISFDELVNAFKILNGGKIDNKLYTLFEIYKSLNQYRIYEINEWFKKLNKY